MKIRTGLVGCGKISQKHLLALVHQDNLDLMATADTNLERAEAAAVAFDAEPFESLETMLAKTELDALIIATPSGLHRSQAEYAMRRKIHVLVEKPLALNYNDAQDMVRMAKNYQVILGVTQFNRLLPSVVLALDLHRNNGWGKLLQGGVDVRWSRPQAYYEDAEWRGTRQMDGGILWNQAIHAIDLLVQFFGPADQVFAHSATLTHAIQTEDTVTASVRFETGALATINATTSVPLKNLEERMTVIGEKGAFVLGPSMMEIQGWLQEEKDLDEVRMDLSQLPSRAGWQSHKEALDDFAGAIRRNTKPALSADTTLDTIVLLEALTKSMLDNRPVRTAECKGI